MLRNSKWCLIYMAAFAITRHLKGPNVIFSYYFIIYFSFFFAFLGSAGTKKIFIFMLERQFSQWFGLQRGKPNMQKTTFEPLKCSVIANGAIYTIHIPSIYTFL